MLQLVITLFLCLTLAQSELSCAGMPKRNPLHVPCRALYFQLQDERNRCPPVHRASQCDKLAWSESSQLLYVHEAYNPHPATVSSHGRRLGLAGGYGHVAWHLVKVYYERVKECSTGPPEAECYRVYDSVARRWRWLPWGTDEAQVARLQCPKKEEEKEKGKEEQK